MFLHGIFVVFQVPFIYFPNFGLFFVLFYDISSPQMKVHQGVTVPSLMWKGFLPMRRQRSKMVIGNFCVLCFFSCTHVVGCGGGDVCSSVIEHQTCDR